jgi:hypothetical protein
MKSQAELRAQWERWNSGDVEGLLARRRQREAALNEDMAHERATHSFLRAVARDDQLTRAEYRAKRRALADAKAAARKAPEGR